MRVLVTGCAGFIASHVCDHLLAAGREVHGLDDLSGGSATNIPEGMAWTLGSICDVDVIEHAFKIAKPDVVIHCAAYAAEGLSHWIRRHNYDNNVVGSANVINACIKHNVKRIVFTSSIGVYGYGSPAPPFHEAMTPRPIDPYGIAKYSIEMDLQAAHRLWGLEYVITRPHNVYGPRQNMRDPYRNVVGIFMAQCMRGEPMTIFGDGFQRRAFSFIDDVAKPIALCVDLIPCGTIVNLGGRDTFTINDLAGVIGQVTGSLGMRDYLPARNEVRDAFCDQTIANAIFGAVLQFDRKSLREGIEAMYEWARSLDTPQRGERFGKIDLDRDLPQIWKELAEGRGCHAF